MFGIRQQRVRPIKIRTTKSDPAPGSVFGLTPVDAYERLRDTPAMRVITDFALGTLVITALS
jgi:hypothetical protein